VPARGLGPQASTHQCGIAQFPLALEGMRLWGLSMYLAAEKEGRLTPTRGVWTAWWKAKRSSPRQPGCTTQSCAPLAVMDAVALPAPGSHSR